MPFANPEARRAYDRQRYAEKKGYLPNPGNGSQSDSLPRFVPEGRTLPDFQPRGHKGTLASAQNWWRDHSPAMTGVIIPFAAGVGIGFVGTLFFQKYVRDVGEKAKALISSYLPRQNRQEQPVDRGQALYDFSLDVMRRQAGTD